MESDGVDLIVKEIQSLIGYVKRDREDLLTLHKHLVLLEMKCALGWTSPIIMQIDCLHCGGKAALEVVVPGDRMFYFVRCQNCDARTGWKRNPGEAVKAWSRRTNIQGV